MICGIDEAGRGPLAGPLVVAGAVLNAPMPSLDDSKKLSEKKREELYKHLQKNAEFLVVCFSHEEIDAKGLSVCLKSAIETIKERFSECDIIMDGNTNFGVNGVRSMVKADTKVKEVSAASILAKVTRDHIMDRYDSLYPEYGFLKHKGYGTAFHTKMIKENGYSPIHRKSFKLKSLMQPSLFE